MSKLYDVYFTLSTPANMVIEAEDQESAEEALRNMTSNELIERIHDAVDYMGVEITDVQEVDNGVGKTRGVAIAILDMFEDILDENGIMIPDEDRTGADGEACLYGMTYANLENRIVELLVDYIDE